MSIQSILTPLKLSTLVTDRMNYPLVEILLSKVNHAFFNHVNLFSYFPSSEVAEGCILDPFLF